MVFLFCKANKNNVNELVFSRQQHRKHQTLIRTSYYLKFFGARQLEQLANYLAQTI